MISFATNFLTTSQRNPNRFLEPLPYEVAW